jgi:hypothetical protein
VDCPQKQHHLEYPELDKRADKTIVRHQDFMVADLVLLAPRGQYLAGIRCRPTTSV